MILVILISIISFFLQGIVSNYLNYTIINPSIFSTIYTLVALVILNKYFENQNKYYLVVFIFGLLYDIVYTNTFILNAVLFLAISIIAKLLLDIFSDTLINLNIINLLSIIIYHSLIFAILRIIGYNIYSFKLLFTIISHSIIMTIIYTTVLSLLTNYLFVKFEIKSVR